MSKKKGTGINIGSISILVIFVLLCLTTFATLSLVSAKADAKLTKTSADSLQTFYIADSKAEDVLASIDNCLKSVNTANNKEEYFTNCIAVCSKLNNISILSGQNNLIINYIIEIEDNKELQISVEVLYPLENNDNQKRYRLLKWQTVYTGEWESDDSLNLFNNS